MKFPKFSWLLPIATLFLMLIGLLGFNAADYPIANVFFCLAILILFFVGFVFGILGIALKRSRKSKSLIVQSIIGIVINMFFLILLASFIISGFQSVA